MRPDAVMVTLTFGEFWASAQVGFLRDAEAVLMQRVERFAEKKTGELWGAHIQSAIAELAVAKHLRRHWGFGVNEFHVPDITGLPVEVRWTDRADIKVRPDDKPHMFVVGVGPVPAEHKPPKPTSLQLGQYRVAINGWIRAGDGKRPEWECKDEPPCYFAPHSSVLVCKATDLKKALRAWVEAENADKTAAAVPPLPSLTSDDIDFGLK